MRAKEPADDLCLDAAYHAAKHLNCLAGHAANEHTLARPTRPTRPLIQHCTGKTLRYTRPAQARTRTLTLKTKNKTPSAIFRARPILQWPSLLCRPICNSRLRRQLIYRTSAIIILAYPALPPRTFHGQDTNRMDLHRNHHNLRLPTQ